MLIAALTLIAADLGEPTIFPASASVAQQAAFRRCATRIASTTRGEVSRLTVDSVHRYGRTTTYRGTFNALRKPPPAGTGMMAPTHVISTGFAFRCGIRARRSISLSIWSR